MQVEMLTIGTSNRMASSAMNDNFPSLLDKENLAP